MYKNWKEIVKIEDVHFMWALSLVDLESDFGKNISKRFPEYFCEEEQLGPIPFSVLKMIARENAPDANCNPDEHLVSYEAIPPSWPLIRFGDDDVVEEHGDIGFRKVPEELKYAKNIGETYSWEGKDIILVDKMSDYCPDYVQWEWEFVPAELILTDENVSFAEKEESSIHGFYGPHECIRTEDVIEAREQNDEEKIQKFMQMMNGNHCPMCARSIMLGMTREP